MATEKKSNKRVLVVDDEPDFAVLATSILKDGGYEASIALSAEEAMARVQSQKPDLVTLDLQMPGHSGLLFYRELKKRPAYRDLPVVVISGFAGNDLDREKFIKHFLEPDHIPHPDAYLDKPLGQDDFLRAVGNILDSTGERSSE